jgi:hypothetical protein
MIKHPEVEVRLTGLDGNAYAILGKVVKALRDAGYDKAEVEKFKAEATNGDYDHLIQTAMKWVNVT